MKRLLLLSSMVLAVGAFTGSTGARANVFLTETGGIKLLAGAKITATSINFKTTLAGGNTIECANVTLHFDVRTNGNSHVLLEQLGAATTSNCVLNAHPTIGVTFPTTVTDLTVGVAEGRQLTINTWGTGNTLSASVSHSYIGAHTPENQIVTCHYIGTLHIEGIAPAVAGVEVMPSHMTKTPGEESCPSSEASVHGLFAFETSNEEPVFLGYNSTP